MKNKILFVLVLVLSFSFYSKVSANELCSSTGYSIYTINGINTNEVGAIKNMNSLKSKFSTIYNNQPLKVDYLYNPTHLGGALDVLDVIAQGVFDEKSDYDLTNMLSDASQKVTTQKVLLVGHSQGNFYANNFYDKVADKEGGVPSESIGVYGVASPASYVAGGGKYLTSDTDVVINKVAGRIMNVLKPNTHIALQNGDDNLGHDFSGVYLKYQGDRIVSEIKSSLDKLRENDEQDSGEPCISAPKITALYKVEGAALATADFIVNGTQNIFSSISNDANNLANAIGNGAHNVGLAVGNIFGGLSANVVESLPDRSSLTTLLPIDSMSESELANDNSTQEQNISNGNQIPQPVDTSVADAPITSSAPIVSGTDDGGNDNQPVINDNGSNNSNNNGGDFSGTSNSNTNTDTTETGKTNTSNDTTPPVISIVGDNPISIIKGSIYTDAGATANDETDGILTVTSTGNVDTNTLGTYTITYTASDSSNNIATATRTVNVVADTGSSTTPSSTLDTTPPVITVLGNTFEVVTYRSSYTDAGASALDDVDGSVVVDVSGTVDTTNLGYYFITYTATDKAGNVAKAVRTVKVSTYKYIPKYSFGTNNGDGHDWQVWQFSGSNVYGWSDTYVNNYLREQFVIQNYPADSCLQCLQRGIFNHDPQKGFEVTDLALSSLERSPQSSGGSLVYNVNIQWDSTGYTYTISRDGSIYATGHTDVPNVNENTWVGWDGSFNNFQTFPMGSWLDNVNYSMGRTGGDSMITKPYPVYSTTVSSATLSSEKVITEFNFNKFTPKISGIINETNHTVSVTVPFGTDLTNLWPVAVISKGALINLDINKPQDFTHPVTYTVSAEDGSVQNYVVTVTVDSDPNLTPPVILSSLKSITGFSLKGLNPEVIGTINETDHTVSLSVPYGTDVTNIVPTITISDKASINPNNNIAQNFTSPVTYTVTAEDNSIQNYVVTVTVAPNPIPLPDIIPPSILSYTLNGTAGDITVNPLENPISLSMTASEKVNWTSIRIEKQDDTSVYKIFYSGSGCVDGTDTCTKTWDGNLSKGSFQDGTFRIKVHMKDLANNEFNDYLLPFTITVNTSI